MVVCEDRSCDARVPTLYTHTWAAFKAKLHLFMRAHDQAEVVLLEEAFGHVGPEQVAGPPRFIGQGAVELRVAGGSAGARAASSLEALG